MLSLLQMAANHNYQLMAAVISGVFIGVWLDALAKRWDKKGQDEYSPRQQLGRDMLWLAAKWDNVKRQGVWADADDYNSLMPETLAVLVRLGKFRITTYINLKEEIGIKWFENLSMYLRTVGHLLKDGNLKYARVADKNFMRDADQ